MREDLSVVMPLNCSRKSLTRKHEGRCTVYTCSKAMQARRHRIGIYVLLPGYYNIILIAILQYDAVEL